MFVQILKLLAAIPESQFHSLNLVIQTGKDTVCIVAEQYGMTEFSDKNNEILLLHRIKTNLGFEPSILTERTRFGIGNTLANLKYLSTCFCLFGEVCAHNFNP